MNYIRYIKMYLFVHVIVQWILDYLDLVYLEPRLSGMTKKRNLGVATLVINIY